MFLSLQIFSKLFISLNELKNDYLFRNNKKMNRMKKENLQVNAPAYEAPFIEMVEVVVEKGLNISSASEGDPGEWDNEGGGSGG